MDIMIYNGRGKHSIVEIQAKVVHRRMFQGFESHKKARCNRI